MHVTKQLTNTESTMQDVQTEVNKFQSVICRYIMNGYSWLSKRWLEIEFKWHNWLHGTDLKP
jgi:hypothetical protein